MEYKDLSAGTQVPVLGLGTWEIGGRQEKDTSRDQQDIAAIGQAIEMGYTHIDTAEAYGAGHAEELVGAAIKGFKRESLFITTKVSKTHLRYEALLASARDSLTRLETDYLDLYLVHHPNPDIPVRETMQALDHLVQHKLVRHIGVSNFNADQIMAAQACTKNKIAANQIEYNLHVRNQGMFNTGMESEIIPYCRAHGILVIVWRPLDKGALTRPGIPLLDELAGKYGKTPAQVALNWLVAKQNLVAVIKSTNPAHLSDNLGALGWQLDRKDQARLDIWDRK